ncbi:uncharacterized protein LOC111070423 [Drosophila obscura]|uniref:uncharacterized protein LOC111070423 n=1 Tax=Drosophila obscura TaxID=7282 RepID=UPI001BB16E97|nr:uncharacterized protein LOC111070423 [Drosophila obscura]
MNCQKETKMIGPPRLCVSKSSLDRLIDRELRMQLNKVYESFGKKSESACKKKKKSASWRPFRAHGLEGAILGLRQPAWNRVPPIPFPAVTTNQEPSPKVPQPILRFIRSYSCLPKPKDYFQASQAQWLASTQAANEFTGPIEMLLGLMCLMPALFFALFFLTI